MAWLLLGVLLVYFDVATAMVLFSIIQITANGWRAVHWRRFVLWPIFYWYVAGAPARLRGDAIPSPTSPTRRWSTSCSG